MYCSLLVQGKILPRAANWPGPALGVGQCLSTSGWPNRSEWVPEYAAKETTSTTK